MSVTKLLYRCARQRWHRVVAVVAMMVGSVAMLTGWLGISRATLTTEQIPYLASGGLGGLFALGVAATLWLSGDMHDEFDALQDIRNMMADAIEANPTGAAPSGSISPTGKAPRTAIAATTNADR
ncbi:MAG TPA: hypothetical protein VJ010_06020 [Actinomycetota bacterium]|nr:hypothetical protein [Actinomycetota bacterium]